MKGFEAASNHLACSVRECMTNPYASSQQTSLSTGSPQSLEGYALVEMARRMAALQAGPFDRDEFLHAVRTNWRIWTIIQANLIDPECDVPAPIRENLLSLSNFIDKRSAELLGKQDPAALTVLININRQIGAGLMGNPGEGVANAPAALQEQGPGSLPGGAEAPIGPTDTSA